MRALLLVAVASAAAAAALACTHLMPAKDRTRCAEFQDLVCLTEPTCTLDEARGCRVCQCSSAMAPSAGHNPEDYGKPEAPRDRNQAP